MKCIRLVMWSGKISINLVSLGVVVFLEVVDFFGFVVFVGFKGVSMF